MNKARLAPLSLALALTGCVNLETPTEPSSAPRLAVSGSCSEGWANFRVTGPSAPETPSYAITLDGVARWSGTLPGLPADIALYQPGHRLMLSVTYRGELAGVSRLNCDPSTNPPAPWSNSPNFR